MKTLLVITHVDFWRKGAGHRSRLSALLNYLKDRLAITVVYAGVFSQTDQQKVSSDYPGITIKALEPNRTITFKEHGELFKLFISGKRFDIVLIEYIDMAFVLPLIDSSSLTVLDTHDLVADRTRSFRENNLRDLGIHLNDEEELDIFNCFDKVLLIQSDDYQKIGQQIGFERAMMVPHAPQLRKRNINTTAKNIGFVASEYAPNVAAISWFLDTIWPGVLRKHDVTLNVYGNVCKFISPEFTGDNDHIILHGFVDDLDSVYNHCDIKNMEAMACGLPLITTSHGSAGINQGTNECFLVADSPAEFASAVDRLLESKILRDELSAKSFAFVASNFSPAACYGELMNCMLQYQLVK